MSVKTINELNEFTKNLGFCAVHRRSGEYMNVPTSVGNREDFKKFLKAVGPAFYLLDIIK